jgi:hypothetical protein
VRRGWRRYYGRTVRLHTRAGTFEGVLVLASRDIFLLRAARLLSATEEDAATQLVGETVVPRERVDFGQVS